jgi:hypothetical protein
MPFFTFKVTDTKSNTNAPQQKSLPCTCMMGAVAITHTIASVMLT